MTSAGMTGENLLLAAGSDGGRKPQVLGHSAQISYGLHIQPPTEMFTAESGKSQNNRLGRTGDQHVRAVTLFDVPQK